MKPQTPASGDPGEPSDETLRAWLSDLADGEADAAGAQAACQGWRERADLRQTWHAYHLIGDTLRSEELARPAAGDAAFLARLREKLADEPVVLAPMPAPAAAAAVAAPAPARRRQSWLMPAAAAAGFMAVASVLVVTQLSAPAPGAAGPLQARTAPGAGLALVGAPAPVSAGTAAGAAMIRDARLDAYLQAHQAVRGGGAAVVPGVGLRSVETVVPAGNGR